MNNNQLKLEVLDSCQKDEKLTTNYEPSNNEDVINRACLDEKLSKIDGQITI